MRSSWVVFVLAVGASASFAADAEPAWNALVSPAGSLRLARGGRDVGSLLCGLFEAEWRSASMGAGSLGTRRPSDNVLRSQIRAPGGGIVDTEMTATPDSSGLRLKYRLTPRQPIALNSLHVDLHVPASLLAGRGYTVDGERAAFPAAFQQTGLKSGPVSKLSLQFAEGDELQFQFPEPTPVLLQDDRQWSEHFSVRIGPQLNSATPWPAGKALELAFVLSAARGMGVEFDEPVTITAGRDWVPLDLELDIEAGSVLDWSNLVPWHAPAGVLGRVVASQTGQLTFEKKADSPVRFYGCNLCFSAHYLTHEQSDRLALRLRRLGYNALRLHHYESMLVDRSSGSSTKLNPDRLDELDYLFYACKQQGIYTTTDLYVSRPVFAQEVWPGETGDVGMDEFKIAVPVNARAFANYRDFAAALLNHTNPYTKMRWADDPALAWLSLINEPNPGNFIRDMKPRLQADYQRAWHRWLTTHHPQLGTLALPTGDQNPEHWLLLNQFLADNQREFFAQAKNMLRADLGCKALLTNLNAWTNPVQIEAVRPMMDYVDDHFYVDHPEFIERPWRLPSRCPNTSPVAQGAPGGRSCAFIRLLDRPFTCSEFNYSGPGAFRGVGGILTGALGAVQDWSIIWRFTYSHSRDNEFAPGPANYFDLVTDPLSQAADRASICLFRRADMRPAAHSIAVALTPADALASPRSVRGIVPSWNALAWVTKVGSLVIDDPQELAADLVLPLGWGTPTASYGSKALNVDPYAPEAGSQILDALRARDWLAPDNPTDLKAPKYQSETGELTIDAPADTLTIDTQCTAGGYAPAGSSLRTKMVNVEVRDVGATVWVSSVDGQAIPDSRRLLVTHLTDLQNAGNKYADRARTTLTEWGQLPHLMRTGRALLQVRLKNAAAARVWSVSTSGKRLNAVPARAADGALVIELNMDVGGKAQFLYEIEVPGR
jgi:hypothetical protein